MVTEKTGTDPYEAGALAARTHEVFVRPFESGGGERCILLQNIGNTHPDCMYDDDGNVLDAYNIPGPLDQKGAAVCAVKDTRMLAPARGNTIINQRDPRVRSPIDEVADAGVRALVDTGTIGEREAEVLHRIEAGARDYTIYLMRTGLLDHAGLHSLLFTSSFTDFDEILRTVAASGKRALPYNPAPAFISLCKRYGVKTYGRTPPQVGSLNNKHRFRGFVERSVPGAYPYPRRWYPAGVAPDPGDLAELVEVSLGLRAGRRSDPGGAVDVLFIQKDMGGGGSGNYRVTGLPDGGFAIRDRRDLGGLDDVAGFVAELGADLEVAPFLPLASSPSFGIVVGHGGVSCLGPFQQLLNHDQDYVGFRLDAGGSLLGLDPDVADLLAARLPEVLGLCGRLGELQRQGGYFGYSSLDAFIYRDQMGKPRLSYSEENLRFTGTCMLQMLVHQRPDLRNRFLRGELSMLHHDLVPVSERTLRLTRGTTTGLAALLRSRGVPLVDRDHPFGAILMAKPSHSIQGFCVGVGVVAPGDAVRDRWIAAATRALG
jgi:hypothetical protein